MTLSYPTIKRIGKKGGFGLPDFFSILAFFLIILIFYFLIKITVGAGTFEISEQSSDIADSISLINILKTPVTVEDTKMNMAELIALSKIDQTKKPILEQNLNQIIDSYFDASKCAVICIDKEKLKGKGCSSSHYFSCLKNIVMIPTYDNKAIEVSFKSDVAEPQLQAKPLK